MKKLFLLLLLVPVLCFGQDNYSLKFDGIDDIVDLTNTNIAVQGDGSRTIMFWMKKTPTNDWRNVLCTGSFISSGTPSGNRLVITPDGNLRFANWSAGITTSDVANNQWHHIALAVGAGEVRLYVDSELVASAAITCNTQGQDNYIGQSNYVGLDNFYDGWLDELSFWDKKLTNSEISELYQHNINPNASNLIAYYDFNDITNNTLSDITENGNDGIINGATLSSEAYVVTEMQGCTDPLASNYNSAVLEDDGSCYLDVDEGIVNQNILDNHHGDNEFLFKREINNNGGVRFFIRTKSIHNHVDWTNSISADGDVKYVNIHGNLEELLDIYNAGTYDDAPSYTYYHNSVSFSNNHSWEGDQVGDVIPMYRLVDFIPFKYQDFMSGDIEVVYNPSVSSPNPAYNHIRPYLHFTFNAEMKVTDYGSTSSYSIDEASLVVSDNGVTVNNDFFELSDGYGRITKGIRRLHSGEGTFNDIDGDYTNNIEYITPDNNSYTFEVGPKQDNVFGAYEIWVGDVNTDNSSLIKYSIDNIQTLPYIPPSNIFAVNDANGHVKISWIKESSIPTSELIYYVDRGELAADGESIIWNDGDSLNARYVYNGNTGQIINRTNNDVAYTGDDEFGYTDLDADPTKTYIYRIRTAGATDNVYYDGLDGENAMAMGTGAGIEFPVIYLPTDASTNQCGSVLLKWNDVGLNDDNYPDFTWNETGYSWSDKFYKINAPIFENSVYEGAATSYTVTLDDNQFGEQSFLVLTSATRSDGKVFTSFYPTIIKGERIPLPTEVTTFSGASNSSAYTLSWDEFEAIDNVDNIVISYSSSNGDETHELDRNETSHDADIASCEDVQFTITTENCQSSTVPKSSTIKTTSGVYVPDVHNTFIYKGNLIEGEAFKDLEVSAGEFGDRIELFWENNNNSAVNSFEVMRRVVVDDNSTSFQKIGETSRDVHAYTDLYADANQLYEYQIQAKFDCTSDVSSLSDITSVQPSNKAVGFRAPTSDLYGRITYDNGSPAEDIIVTANTSDPFLNKSLFFEDGAHIELDDIFQNQTDNSFSVMAWFRPDYTQEGLSALFSRINSDNGNGLHLVVDHDNRQLKVYDETSNGGLVEVVGTQSIEVIDGWQQISVTYDHSLETLNIYLNGELVFNHTLSESFSDTDEFTLGIENPLTSNSISLNSYSGYVDEISIWSDVLTDGLIANTFGNYFSNHETNLLAYYHCDEGAGDSIYDISKNEIGIFHKNNSRINEVSFSSHTPSQDQIGYKGLSDDMGYYSVRGIRFNHTGSNFNITPTKSVITALDNDSNLVILEPAHEFTPAVSSAFFGDGIDYLSNYDFTDISSFDVTGHVYYLDPNSSVSDMCTDVSGNAYSMYNEDMILASCSTEVSLINGNVVSNIGVEGAALYIDNEPAYDAEGNQIYTNENGAFSIEVPIGRHQISIQKEGHTFVNEVWNSSNHTEIIIDENTADAEVRKVYNFTQNLSNLTFYDNTVRTLVGRVCGGTTQANKTYGNEASINNIGQAEFTLKNVGTEVHSIVVTTDEATGEYSANLLPLEYQIKSDVTLGTLFEVTNNGDANNYFKVDAGNGQPYPFPIIDMREKGNLYNYSQGFYDDIISVEDLNEIGKQMELVEGSIDSSQVISDSVLVQYYDLINNPNTIVIDNSGNDDYDNYPYLFNNLSHQELEDYYSAFEYDRAENFVYRVSPSIEYYTSMYDHDGDANTDAIEINGEPYWELVDESDPSSSIQLSNINYENATVSYNFIKPIFEKDKEYSISTIVKEVYYNNNTEVTDEVIVETGQLYFSDGVISETYTINERQTNIPFTPRFVNTSLDGGDSFQQNFTLTYTEGVVAVDETLDYYVFGLRPDEGTTYFSSGPDVVEMVLRDPPGDASHSYIQSGSSKTEEISVHSVGFSIGEHLKKEVNLGTEITMSFFAGPEVTTEVILNTDLDLVSQYLEGETTKNTVTTTFNESYQTSSNPYNIGAGGDVYIARNYNILYGTNHYLEIVDKSMCTLQGIVCLGETTAEPNLIGNGSEATVIYTDETDPNNPIEYTLGTSVGLDIVPVGFESKTVYDQNHIVHNLIPTLKWIRNSYFGLDGVYSLNTSNSNPCYDNESHPNYSSSNLTPCYTYNEALDGSDPLALPFDAYEDINLSEFIPEEFEELVMNYMIHAQNGNGEFYNFSNESIEVLEQLANSMESGNDVMNVIHDIASQSFWQDVATILGGHNLLSGLSDFTNALNNGNSNVNALVQGLGNLQSYIDDIEQTLPGDKVKFYNDQIKLWETAIELNELDKLSIISDVQGANTNALNQGQYSGSAASLVLSNPISHIGDVLEGASSFGPDDNVSFSAGNTISSSSTYSQSKTKVVSIDYSIKGEIAFEIGAKVNGFGGSYNDIIPISFSLNETESTTNSSNVTFGYVLNDDDEADFISVDVKDSDIGFGPIFRKRAGQTMCPHEAEEGFLYLDAENYPIIDQLDGLFSVATQPREVPGIAIEPSLLTNVPEMEQAVFNLSLTNNSAAMQDMVYTLMVDEASNPYGAIIKMDGLPVFRQIMVPYGQTIHKTITVEKGPEYLDYIDNTGGEGDDDRLSLILRSSCQYSYGTSNTPDIADTISFGVSYLPGCTSVNIVQPVENWVINKATEETTGGVTTNITTFELDGYDYNYYSLDNILLQYKKSNEPESAYATQTIVQFQKVDEEGGSLEEGNSELEGGSVQIEFDTQDWEDGDYDLRAYTDCQVASEEPQVASEESVVVSGHKDTRTPEPFGAARPADGVLEPNDEVSVQWTEEIDESSFYSPQAEITVSAIKNNAEIRHDAYLYLGTADELTIPTGVNLQNKSFTIEMWVKPEASGLLLEQGYDSGEKISLGIDDNNKLFAEYNNTVIANSTTSISLHDWNHVAFVFDNQTKEISFLTNGSLADVNDVQDFNCVYMGEGAIMIGDNYSGALHNLRIWSTSKLSTSVYANMLQQLSGTEAGLLGCWPMNELSGFPIDLARARNMEGTINWTVAEKGKGYNFNASENLKLTADFGTVSFDQTHDFTIEFWFKTDGPSEIMFSTGTYSLSDSYGDLDAWSIGLNANGKLKVLHSLNNSSTTLMESADAFNDGQWHHLALVKNAKTNTVMYIDGVEEASVSSELTRAFASPQLTLGAEAYQNSASTTYSQYFTGSLDEVRVWSLARPYTQIERYKHIRLNGNEVGLEAYYPFETYEEASGVMVVTGTGIDQADILNLTGFNSEHIESDDLPLMKMINPVETISFNSLLNGDETLITLTEDLKNIEGCILDVSIDGIQDLYGNPANPISWSFYVDKNQLIWNEELIEKEKLLGEPLVFETHIENLSGAIEHFEISNLPEWLEVTPSEGLLEPNSYTEIEFIVHEDLFIGDYEVDILLTGNNEYAEKLNLHLEVYTPAPLYDLNPNEFAYSMNFIGKVDVDAIRSRDEDDILFAYVNDELRGASDLLYLEDYDAYIVLLSVYSNTALGEDIEFVLWDASEGKLHSHVTINEEETYSFHDGDIVGAFDDLVSFHTYNMLIQEIPLSVGWNWVSFNLDAQDDTIADALKIGTVSQELSGENVLSFKHQTDYVQYAEIDGTEAWYGNLNQLPIEHMYMLNLTEADTLVYEGLVVEPSLVPIGIVQGWNWISYLGQRILEINQALSSLNPTVGDVIKSKSGFSMYASESLGWLGTLTNMNSGEGYMLYQSDAVPTTLTYPNSSMYLGSRLVIDDNQLPSEYWKVNTAKYEHSMSIIARIDYSDYDKPNTENLLAAFVDSECVGNISATKIDEASSLYFITVYGESSDLLQFKYYDAVKNKAYRLENNIIFEANAILGSVDNPYTFVLDQEPDELALELSVYPNPFNEQFDLAFELEKESTVHIQIVDLMGRWVENISTVEYDKGFHKLEIDGSRYAKGVYYIELIIGDVSYKKLIIKS